MRASREEVRRILALLLLLLPTGPASETLHLSVMDKDGRRYREKSGANITGAKKTKNKKKRREGKTRNRWKVEERRREKQVLGV